MEAKKFRDNDVSRFGDTAKKHRVCSESKSVAVLFLFRWSHHLSSLRSYFHSPNSPPVIHSTLMKLSVAFVAAIASALVVNASNTHDASLTARHARLARRDHAAAPRSLTKRCKNRAVSNTTVVSCLMSNRKYTHQVFIRL